MKKISAVIAAVLLIVLAVGCGEQAEESGVSKEDAALIAEELKMPEERGATTDFQSFATVDLYGEEVTEQSFSDYEYTMVYVWGTYCNPCIDALPDMDAVAREYGDKGVNVIGMVVDVQNQDYSPNPEMVVLARDIADAGDVTFKNLLIPSNIMDSVMVDVRGTPTTFIVDKEGNVVSAYEGGYPYKKWKEILDEMLSN